jgi:hypothetical protein
MLTQLENKTAVDLTFFLKKKATQWLLFLVIILVNK